MTRPNRSPESIARRREESRAWRLAHREYFARWRHEHRDSENARKYRLRAAGMRDNVHRASRALPDIPALHVGHPLFDQAREIVGRRTGSLVTLYDTSYDDHIGTVVLALVEGADPAAALQASRRFFTSWRFLDIADIAA